MKTLSARDYRQLLECIAQLYEQQDFSRLKQALPAAVNALVPADLVMLGHLDLRRTDVNFVSHPADARPNFTPERVAMVYEEHPVLQFVKRTGYAGALKLSDFLTRRQFHQTRMYHEWMREENAEFSINFQALPPELPFVTSISMTRGAKDFSETDRLKLDLLRPHISRAYAMASKISQLRAQALSLAEALTATHQGVIGVSPCGAVTFCTDQARKHLAAYFKGEEQKHGSLPENLLRWMRKHDLPGGSSHRVPSARRPLVVEGDGVRLTVHFVASAVSSQRLLLLEEKRTQLTQELLQRHFGLNPRRAEVLLWIAQGKTSAEIAMILGLSISTVRKHTERIFEALGVETRTAAALQATQALAGP